MKYAIITLVLSVIIVLTLDALTDNTPNQPQRSSAPADAPLPNFKVQ
jgi:hypothetical protein